jgi:hypothetical protein
MHTTVRTCLRAQALLQGELQLQDGSVALVPLPQQTAALQQRARHAAGGRLQHRRLRSLLVACWGGRRVRRAKAQE